MRGYYDSAAAAIPDRMAEKLKEVLKCSDLSEYKIAVPARTYTYLLNDMGEEFKARPILLSVFSDESEVGTEQPEKEQGEKKGFFRSLFGKK